MRGLSMHIPAGRTVALCGKRGCGKSTTLSLIQRQYDVDAGAGSIEINGKSIQAYEPRTLRTFCCSCTKMLIHKRGRSSHTKGAL